MARLFSLALVGGLFWGCASTQPVDPPPTPPSPPPASDAEPAHAATDDAPAANDPLPLDPAVRTGVLPNGLAYYVRPNQEPRDRAELRLVVDAGSVLEDDDQRGLAHLLEHMAFNGTERFPEQELVRYLESTGMQFGPDVNAYTSFDETVYMLQVPTDSADIFQTGLDVLREWAGNVTITNEEVDKERGVVLEERRLRRGAQGRVQDVQYPVFYRGSRYAERLPIGTEEVLQNTPPQRVRDFYNTWYRPDLMAVVVVGDVDADAVVAMIEDRFGDLENPTDEAERPTYEVPDHDETLVTVVTDPELPQGRVQVLLKREPREVQTAEDVRQSLVIGLFNGMLNARLQELAQSADPPFAVAFASLGGGLRAVDLAQFLAIVPADGGLAGLEALLTETERVRRHGFTESELERAEADVLNGLERALAERDQTPSRAFASQLVNTYLEGSPTLGIDDRAALTRRFLPTISLDDVNALADDLLEEENRVVGLALPEVAGADVPTEADVRAVLAAVERAEIEPYADDVSDEPLVPEPPTPGEVVSQTDLGHGVTDLTLANGVRVLVKPTDFQNDEVLLYGFSPGGTSLLDLDTYRATQLAAGLANLSGAGAFDATALQKKLAGQTVNVSAFLGEREEGFRGQASPDDLETLFQLVYLNATAPRRDEAAFASLLQRYRSILANRSASPEAAFGDTLTVTLAQNHPRRQPFDTGVLDRADLDASVRVLTERFADADDFTFVIVGNVDLDTLTPLVETYLGGLPTLPRTDEPRDVGVERPAGVVRKTVRRGVEPKAQVQLVFHGDLDETTLDTEATLDALGQVLTTQLRETLREDLGGTYSVRATGNAEREPRPAYTVSIGFGADPGRVDELIEAVMADIVDLQANGPEERYVENVRESARRSQETALRENGFWLNTIAGAVRYDVPLDEALTRNERLEAATPASVQAAAQRYLDTDQYVQVVLLPEEAE